VPELPEVETVRRGLVNLVKGYKIVRAHDLHPRALKPESIAPLKSIQGAKIIDLNRRGKFLWFVLDRPQVLVAHLGMSGQFLIHQQGHPRAKHVRAQFDLTKQMRKRELLMISEPLVGYRLRKQMMACQVQPSTLRAIPLIRILIYKRRLRSLQSERSELKPRY
jgi:formamidopyrimidine-DNA glycosylase